MVFFSKVGSQTSTAVGEKRFLKKENTYTVNMEPVFTIYTNTIAQKRTFFLEDRSDPGQIYAQYCM